MVKEKAIDNAKSTANWISIASGVLSLGVTVLGAISASGLVKGKGKAWVGLASAILAAVVSYLQTLQKQFSLLDEISDNAVSKGVADVVVKATNAAKKTHARTIATDANRAEFLRVTNLMARPPDNTASDTLIPKTDLVGAATEILLALPRRKS